MNAARRSQNSAGFERELPLADHHQGTEQDTINDHQPCGPCSSASNVAASCSRQFKVPNGETHGGGGKGKDKMQYLTQLRRMNPQLISPPRKRRSSRSGLTACGAQLRRGTSVRSRQAVGKCTDMHSRLTPPQVVCFDETLLAILVELKAREEWFVCGWVVELS